MPLGWHDGDKTHNASPDGHSLIPPPMRAEEGGGECASIALTMTAGGRARLRVPRVLWPVNTITPNPACRTRLAGRAPRRPSPAAAATGPVVRLSCVNFLLPVFKFWLVLAQGHEEGVRDEGGL